MLEQQLDSLLKNITDLGTRKEDMSAIQQWNPKYCGEMDLTIKANGEWWHEGRKIQRQALVNLFASVLWYENGQYYLKTPVEKIKIQVEDAPMQIQSIEQIYENGQPYLQCTTNHQDTVIIDHQHPIFMRKYQQEWRPYVHIRFGLNALVQRSAFYYLIEYGKLQENAQGDTILHLQSGDFCVQLSTPD